MTPLNPHEIDEEATARERRLAKLLLFGAPVTLVASLAAMFLTFDLLRPFVRREFQFVLIFLLGTLTPVISFIALTRYFESADRPDV